MLELESAIKCVEELAEKQEKEAKEWHENQVRKCELIPFTEMDYTHENKCKECAETLRQFAEWLKDYRWLLKQELDENKEAVSREVYDHEFALRKEFDIKAYKLQRQLEKVEHILGKIKEKINSPIRGACDSFILDKIEEIIDKYKVESEEV